MFDDTRNLWVFAESEAFTAFSLSSWKLRFSKFPRNAIKQTLSEVDEVQLCKPSEQSGRCLNYCNRMHWEAFEYLPERNLKSKLTCKLKFENLFSNFPCSAPKTKIGLHNEEISTWSELQPRPTRTQLGSKSFSMKFSKWIIKKLLFHR